MQIGDFQLDVVSGGHFRLDGGSMFGIIPKPLWERVCPADERNRIRLDTNCAVIRWRDEIMLVDTGNGTKLTDREADIFALDRSATLERSLASAGLRLQDITMVVYTHLHMDHCGGGTMPTSGGRIEPTFPKARYFVQRMEWQDACDNRSTMRVSYRAENLRPLEESGRLELLDGDTELLPGLRATVTGGHTRGHQAILIASGGRRAVCFGDLVPTTHHLRATYLMAYDLYPYDTMCRKMPLIEQAARERWAVAWSHDARLPLGRILAREGDRYEAVPPDDSG
jgi:glyoxylase-like metal-dependent hydrolase (beta-lactamase superfamily II)